MMRAAATGPPVEAPATTGAQEETQAASARHASMMKVAGDRWRRRRRRRSIIVRVLQVVLVVAVLGSWELMNKYELVENVDLFYGSPSGTWDYLWENWPTMRGHLLSTLRATLWGFGIGALSGLIVGLALGRWEIADRVLDPMLAVLAGLPRIALAPLFLLWFGITDTAKIAVSVSAVFFVVLWNARAGVRSVDGDYQTVAKLLGANERQMFWKVILPGAVPVLFAGLRLAMIFALLGVIASEMVAAREGLGLGIVTNGQLLQPNGVFAALALLAAMTSTFTGILRLAERRLQRWAPE